MLKRIKTQSEIEKEKRNKQLTIGIVLIGLMVLSTAGYSLMSGEKQDVLKKEYNGIEFVYQNGYWAAEIQKQIFSFQYLPQDLENVSILGLFSLQDYSGKTLYFVNSNPAASEIVRNFGSYFERYQEACLKDKNCLSTELPVKTCDDNVIVFESNLNSTESKTQVYKDKNCVYIKGESMMGADAFMYKTLGVIK